MLTLPPHGVVARIKQHDPNASSSRFRRRQALGSKDKESICINGLVLRAVEDGAGTHSLQSTVWQRGVVE